MITAKINPFWKEEWMGFKMKSEIKIEIKIERSKIKECSKFGPKIHFFIKSLCSSIPRELDWTKRHVEPVKTRMKLKENVVLKRWVYGIHCIVWSGVSFIWRRIHTSAMWRQNQRMRCILSEENKERQRECHKAINHFWPPPKMCK